MKAEIETLAKQISAEGIERIIFQMRGNRVILDSDLAKMYGVTTKALNQAVKRNADRFPKDFAFQLTEQEVDNLRSQIVTANSSEMRRFNPWVFTEHGVAMLSSVLKSKTAVKVNIEIVRTFIRLRQFFAAPGEIVTEIAKLREKTSLHDEQIYAISSILERLVLPPEPPTRRGGFL